MLRIMHPQVPVFIIAAVFQLITSDNFSLKSPVMVTPGGITNSSTMPKKIAEDRFKAKL